MESERLCIRLDNPERIFYAGQVIRGEIWMNLNKRTKIRGKFKLLLLLLFNISQAELASGVSQALSDHNLRSVVKFSDFALSIVIMVSLWPHWHKQRRCLTEAQTKLSIHSIIFFFIIIFTFCYSWVCDCKFFQFGIIHR